MTVGLAWPSRQGPGVLLWDLTTSQDTLRPKHPVCMPHQYKNESTPPSGLCRQSDHNRGPASPILAAVRAGCLSGGGAGRTPPPAFLLRIAKVAQHQPSPSRPEHNSAPLGPAPIPTHPTQTLEVF